MTQIRGQRALITGAANGIGRLLATRLAEAGAKLVLWDIDHDGLKRARDELGADGHDVDVYGCDLGSRDMVSAVAMQTLADSGPIDILINNAGVVAGETLLDLSDTDIERTFEVNTLALFWTTRAFLPQMLDRGHGHIVTIASAAGIAATAKLTDYCASKFAAVGFDESLRQELRQQGSRITTTIVCPYLTDTGMFDGARTRFRWLLPILDPDYVTRRIVTAIRRNRRRVIMPRFVYVAWPARLLPVAWFDGLMRFFGVSDSMRDFRGGS